MLANWLNLWILARLIQAATSTLLVCVGTVLGLGIALRWEPGGSSEELFSLERQAELVAAMVQVALLLEVLGLGLLVTVADHLVGSIRGAMCAFGVLASTESGFVALAATVLTAAACVQWIVLHQLDLETRAPTLTRRKLLWLAGVSLLAILELALTLRFASELDVKVIASCCSVWIDQTTLQDQATLAMRRGSAVPDACSAICGAPEGPGAGPPGSRSTTPSSLLSWTRCSSSPAPT